MQWTLFPVIKSTCINRYLIFGHVWSTSALVLVFRHQASVSIHVSALNYEDGSLIWRWLILPYTVLTGDVRQHLLVYIGVKNRSLVLSRLLWLTVRQRLLRGSPGFTGPARVPADCPSCHILCFRMWSESHSRPSTRPVPLTAQDAWTNHCEHTGTKTLGWVWSTFTHIVVVSFRCLSDDSKLNNKMACCIKPAEASATYSHYCS